MLDWPFLILKHDTPLGLANIAHYLLHPLFLVITLNLGFNIIERKIWGRLSFFVATIFLLALFVDAEWPIINLPEDHAFANFPKPILSLAVVTAYMGWLAWEYRQTALQWIGLGLIMIYIYNLNEVAPIDWYAVIVTLLAVLFCAALFEVIVRIASNYPQIIGLIISIGTIPLVMKMKMATPLIWSLQSLLTSTSIGWILAGSDAPSRGLQLRSLLTVLAYMAGGILLWILLGTFDTHKGELYYGVVVGSVIGLWSTAGLHHIMQFYAKR